MTDAKRIYGIDLGTTYSCIAYVDDAGKPVVLPNIDGALTTPSVVHFEDGENIDVGQTAKDVAVVEPDSVVQTVKRVMGDPDWRFSYEGVDYTPQEISAHILRKLVQDAEELKGDHITDVVITCPAYFGVNEKEATKQAGVLAGLNVRSIIPEPTAAAIVYGIDQSQDQVILVFDLGGGTFDITVVEVKANKIGVICTGGDNNLGGKNWDEAIANWFASEFSSETGANPEDLMSDPETWQELLSSAEKAKLALTNKKSYKHKVRYEGESARVELTREKFDELTDDLLRRTISLTEAQVSVATDEKGVAKIDKILLVGGSTYMPQIMEAVEANYPSMEVLRFDPNQAVAKGAALYALKLDLESQVKERVADETGQDAKDVDLNEVPEEIRQRVEEQVGNEAGITQSALRDLTQKQVQNVTSKSFGIVTYSEDWDEGRVLNLITIDDAVPCEVSRPFYTLNDNQSGVAMRCMENTQRKGPDDEAMPLETSTLLGEAMLEFARPLPKDSPLEFSFRLTEDGLLHAYGTDLTTNGEIEAEFATAAILTREELEKKKARNMAFKIS